jgi:NADPH:quinone reductase-like Zn-dependent oxidoreductase
LAKENVIMTTTRQVRFYELGGPEVLKLERVPVAEPGRGEIRLRVEAIGLNRAENLYRAGSYIYQPRRYPSPIGYEAAGVVEAVGEGVGEFKPGDRVNTIPAFSMAQYGVFGDTAIVPAYAASKYPETLSPEEAASIWMQYVTAYGALIHYANLRTGQTALFTAATGGLGVAAIQMARQLGVRSIATTRSAAKRRLLESLKPDHIIVTDDENVAERVNAITGGRGVDFVWDAVGGSQFPKLVDATARGGQIITYGALAPDAVNSTPMPWFPLIAKGISIRGYVLFELTYDPRRFGDMKPYHPAAYDAAKRYVLEGVASGELKPAVAEVFPLDQIVKAHQYVEENQNLGKVVVRVN